MKLDLLRHFKSASYEEWKEAAEKLLKGAPFEKKMLTKTPEGIVLQPIYREESVEGSGAKNAYPGQGDFLRGNTSSGYLSKPWEIAQEQPYGDPVDFNRALIKDLMGGQSAVNVLLDAATQLGIDPDQADDYQLGECGVSLATIEDVEAAFAELSADYLPVYFQSGCAGAAVQALFFSWLEKKGLGVSQVSGGVNMDPLAVLASRGKLPSSLDSLFDQLADLVKHNAKVAPNFSAAGISTLSYNGAGASANEELASALSSGVAYLRAMAERGVEIDDAAKQVRFTLAVGGDFFMEIAKFRAARALWSRVVRELGGSVDASRMKQHARTAVANKTRLDPYVNMLRTTTEAFSAVLGGADSVCVGCFDETVRLPDDFSRRIARNLQIILQEECELTDVVDPAGGSWYIEKLSDELARKAWESFQELEKEGGILASLKSGKWQEKLTEIRKSKEKMVGQRRVSLIGTNQYPNLDEKPLADGPKTSDSFKESARSKSKNSKDGLDTDALANEYQLLAETEKIGFLVDLVSKGATVGVLSKVAGSVAEEETLDTVLPSWRLSQQYEALRTASANYAAKKGNAPQIFLANLNVLKKHKIRADFTRSFFAAGGFECLYSDGIEDLDAGVKAYKESGAKLAVICGTDPDYEKWVPKLAKALKEGDPDMRLLLAGFPGDKLDEYKAAGLDDYIFVKSDNYQVNKSNLEWLGVL